MRPARPSPRAFLIAPLALGIAACAVDVDAGRGRSLDGGGAEGQDGGPGDHHDAGAHRRDAGPTAPIRVVVISDLNGSYGSTTYEASVHDAVSEIVDLGPDVVLSTGDMVAGQKAGLNYGAMWDGFHAAVSNPFAAAAIPFAVSAGNHDASGYAAFSGERAKYVSEWEMRKPALPFVDDTHYPLYYSFALGDALFIALDSTVVGPLDGAQSSWLAAQLEGSANYKTKVLFGHVPLYAFAVGRETEIIGDAALEALLVAHEVTLFVSGHHHAYYPGKRGPLRLVGTACLGGGPRALIGTGTASPQAYLSFDIVDGAIQNLDAFPAPNFGTAIDRSTLPTS
ncbi:MAG: metallophosphoesterase, partial [Myxococcales bacterium]|nr:metallophosphoesterase [Myxococcales bacterium]